MRDVVVVGASVMGSAAAWWLAQLGKKVTVLERFTPGHQRGSSHGSARIFRLAYPDELYARFAREALGLWRELEAECGEELLTTTGGIDHGDPGAVGGVARTLESVGTRFELLTPEEARRRWPGMAFSSDVLFQPDAGRLNADAAVAALQRCTTTRGAAFRFSEPVRSISPREDEVVIATDSEELRCRVVVVTAGAWLPGLIGGQVSLPPMRITREQPCHFSPLDPEAAWPCFVHHAGPSGADADGLAGVGGYGLWAGADGVKVGEHGTGPIADPDAPDTPALPAGVERLSRYVERWLPGLDPTPTEVMTCLYTTTPDEHFVIDRAGPVVIGSPCSGHGFKFAPAVGRLLASLASGEGATAAEWALPPAGR